MLGKILILILMIFLTSCSGHNYSSECLWYKPVKLSDHTKTWILNNNPDNFIIEDLKKISINNQLFDDLC